MECCNHITGQLKLNIMKRILILELFLLFTLSSSSFSQSEDKLGAWYIYNGFFNFSSKFELFFESQLRTWEVASNPENFFVRPFFNYNFSSQFQMGLGLEYHKTWTYKEIENEKVSDEEFRITLQSMLFQKLDRVSIQHRYRYEIRNFANETEQRIRYRFQVTIPVSNETMDKGTFFANTFFEFMVDTQPVVSLNQNRFYIAGGYLFTKDLNLQLGYMWILRENSTHRRLQFFFTHKLYFY